MLFGFAVGAAANAGRGLGVTLSGLSGTVQASPSGPVLPGLIVGPRLAEPLFQLAPRPLVAGDGRDGGALAAVRHHQPLPIRLQGEAAALQAVGQIVPRLGRLERICRHVRHDPGKRLPAYPVLVPLLAWGQLSQ